MRENKFRAWNPIENKFEYWSLNDLCYHQPDRPDICLQNWQQYTGLKDKNGKEIYEGDLFKREGRNSIDVVIDIRNFACKYEKYEGRLLIEVVGNIDENPSLLK